MLILKRRHIYRFKPRICNISKYCWLEVLRLTKSFSSSLFLDMTDDFSPKLGLTSHIVIVAVTWYRLRYRTNQIKSLFQTLSQKLKSKGLFNKTHLLFLSALFLYWRIPDKRGFPLVSVCSRNKLIQVGRSNCQFYTYPPLLFFWQFGLTSCVNLFPHVCHLKKTVTKFNLHAYQIFLRFFL